jgi:CheY-like chemotaxis protein
MVVEAADVAEAVAVPASGEPVDVVMCDVEMPGTMDGLGLARWINRRHPYPACAPHSRTRRCHLHRQETARTFIAKLYRLEELAECLESMLVSRDWAAAGRSKPKSR